MCATEPARAAPAIVESDPRKFEQLGGMFEDSSTAPLPADKPTLWHNRAIWLMQRHRVPIERARLRREAGR
jgi:hypothetical protein